MRVDGFPLFRRVRTALVASAYLLVRGFALTAGTVLLTLVLNGLSIRKLVSLFGLDRDTDAERVLKTESMIEVQREVEGDLEGLRAEAFLERKVVEKLTRTSRERRAALFCAPFSTMSSTN